MIISKPYTLINHKSVGIRPLLYLAIAFCICTQQGFGAALQIESHVANYDDSPAQLVEESIKVVTRYHDPDDVVLAAVTDKSIRSSRKRIRYMNQMNDQVATDVIEGKLVLKNQTRKSIKVIKLTTVFLDAFGSRIHTEELSIAQALDVRESKTIYWSRALPSQEVYELYFVITAVRFGDDTVWAPVEELIFIP